VRISYAQRRFSTALAEKHAADFWGAIREFVGIIFAAAPINALDPYLSELLILRCCGLGGVTGVGVGVVLVVDCLQRLFDQRFDQRFDPPPV